MTAPVWRYDQAGRRSSVSAKRTDLSESNGDARRKRLPNRPPGSLWQRERGRFAEYRLAGTVAPWGTPGQCECSHPITAAISGHGHACPLYSEEA